MRIPPPDAGPHAIFAAMLRAGRAHDARRHVEQTEARPVSDRVDLCSCPSDRPLPYDEYLERQNRRDSEDSSGLPPTRRPRQDPEPPAGGPGPDPVSPGRPPYAGPNIGDVSPVEPPVEHAQTIVHRREVFSPVGNVIDVFA